MKRIMALVLAVILLMSALPALAEDKPIEQKYYQQAFVESAVRGTVTFEVSGDETKAMDSALFGVLKSLLPRLSLKMEHTTSRASGSGQAQATLTLDNNENAKVTILYDNKLVAMSSTLLGGENTYYTAARDWDWTRLVQSFVQGESQWPPVWRMLLAVHGASEDWKNKSRDKLAVYETKLELWMNSFAKYSSGLEGTTPYTQIDFDIPAASVKQELKALLQDLYNDAELLTQLREVVTAQEAAAYLQPSMRDTLFSMVDQMKMNGNVKIIRRYDMKGNSLLDEISLPFIDGGTLRSLYISAAPGEEGTQYNVNGELGNDTAFKVSCLKSEDSIYTGTVEFTLPEEEGTEFVVSEGEPEKKKVAFSYNLSWDPGEEEYSISTDKFTRTMRSSLLLRPVDDESVPVQALSMELNFSSGSSTRSATQMNGVFTWQDMDSDAAITAKLESRTTSPFIYNAPSDLSGAMRLDLMTQESRTALLNSWVEKVTSFALLLVQASTQGTAKP